MIGFGWGYRLHAASHKQLGACGLKHAASNWFQRNRKVNPTYQFLPAAAL